VLLYPSLLRVIDLQGVHPPRVYTRVFPQGFPTGCSHRVFPHGLPTGCSGRIAAARLAAPPPTKATNPGPPQFAGQDVDHSVSPPQIFPESDKSCHFITLIVFLPRKRYCVLSVRLSWPSLLGVPLGAAGASEGSPYYFPASRHFIYPLPSIRAFLNLGTDTDFGIASLNRDPPAKFNKNLFICMISIT